MSVVGIDGCPKGWCCVELIGDHWSADVLDDIDQVWGYFKESELLLIDIPIGLWDEGTLQRRCDELARKRLKVRRSSVFTPPLRSSLGLGSYEAASAHNHQRSGRKLSKQAWGIAPKIAEVDAFLAREPAARGVLREAHPELLFSCLNGNVPMAFGKKGKDAKQGKAERRQVLAQHFPFTEEVVANIRQHFLVKDVADDDVCDALVAAVSAKLCVANGTLTLPGVPDVDSRGLPMEMVYPLV